MLSLEYHGFAKLYGDMSDISKASYTDRFVARTIVRFQGGIQSDGLEDVRQSAIGLNDIDIKRKSLQRVFNKLLNAIAFNGYAAGSGKTYGLLNDPNLPAYTVLANGATGASPTWASKTFDERYADVQTSFRDLATQTQGAVDNYNDAITWLVSPAVYAMLGTNPATFPIKNLETLIKETYRGVRIVSAPEMATCHAGGDGWYLYAEKGVSYDDSTDDMLSVINTIQSEQFLLSVLPTQSGGTMENHACASSGVIVKRPILFVRRYGAF